MNNYVWIIGTDGQLGTELRKFFKDTNCICTDKELDITDKQAVQNFIKQYNITLIVNAAAYTDVNRSEDEAQELCYKINVIGVQNLVNTGIPLIHISSDYVYGSDKVDTEHIETDEMNAFNYYGKTKQLADEYILEYSKSNPDYIYLVLRVSWVYSSHHNNFVKTIFNKILLGDKLIIINDQIGNITSAEDIAEFIWYISSRLESKYNGIYHFRGDGEYGSWDTVAYEIQNYIINKLNQPLDLISSIPTSAFPNKVRRPLNSKLNLNKFKTTFWYDIPKWKTSLIKVLDTLWENK